MSRTNVTRRGALTCAAGTGLVLPLLAGCGGGESPRSDPAPDPTEPAPAPAGSADEEVTVLTPVADVPVGGGVIIADSRVVVTQPTSGDIKCFSAVCPHQLCLVSSITSTIACTCHNSTFDLSTGEVLGGPSPAPLSPVDFTINDNQVVLT